jgi:4-hydroxy-tetrahydrodipicolinate reductase
MSGIAGTSRGNPPRIVIYGTGQFGLAIARLATQKGWPIVAAFNRAGPKIGQDVGRLAGLDRDLGIIVQDCETSSYEGLSADIGVVTVSNRLRDNLPAYRRLMNAGLNVICHGTEAYFPHGSDAALAAEIDAFARRMGVTFTGGGIWDMSRIWSGILLAGTCTEIHSMFHSSITDCSRIGKAQMMFTGVGLTVEEFASRNLGSLPALVSYKTIPEHVLTALGYTLQGSATTVEPVIFADPIDCPLLERAIPAGQCVGTRIIAEVATEEGVSARAEIELRLFREGEVEHMFWSISGKPVTRVRTEREDSGHASAACLFNRIPDVIQAPPGIVLVSQLGPLKHSSPTRHPHPITPAS